METRSGLHTHIHTYITRAEYNVTTSPYLHIQKKPKIKIAISRVYSKRKASMNPVLVLVRDAHMMIVTSQLSLAPVRQNYRRHNLLSPQCSVSASEGGRIIIMHACILPAFTCKCQAIWLKRHEYEASKGAVEKMGA